MDNRLRFKPKLAKLRILLKLYIVEKFIIFNMNTPKNIIICIGNYGVNDAYIFAKNKALNISSHTLLINRVNWFENSDKLNDELDQYNRIFVTGGTSEALCLNVAVTVGQISLELRKPCYGLFNTPHMFEGKAINENSDDLLDKCKAFYNLMITHSNDQLSEYFKNGLKLKQASREIARCKMMIINHILSKTGDEINSHDIRFFIDECHIDNMFLRD